MVVLAPSATALSTSWPLRMLPSMFSMAAHRVDDGRQGVDGGGRTVAGATG
jgi:hypothetical protein